MKKYIILSLAVLAIALTMESCDKVNGPYRETNGGVAGIGDTVIIEGDTIVFTTDTTPDVKKVLGEDYTGHLCGNCPPAALLLNDTIKSIYHERLVAVSVHAGFYATPCPGGGACPGSAAPPGAFAADYNTTTGTEWNNFFGIISNPNGMIDRVGYPNAHIKNKNTWSSFVQSESLLAPEMKIRIINHYDSLTGKLRTAVHSKFLADKTGEYKLQVVLTEDSIIDWQEWYPPHLTLYVPDYVHHHVLRDAINGSYGETIVSTNVATGDVILRGFSYQVNPSWNASHCKVVAFIYDAADYKVLQVEEVSIQ